MKEQRVRLISEIAKSLDRLRKHLRVTGHDLDAELTACMQSAFSSAEHVIGQIIPVTDIELVCPFASTVTLRRPFIEMTSVSVDGVVLNADQYSITGSTLTIADGIAGDELEVNYRAGFCSIPDDILAAVMLQASSLFSNPLDSVETLPKASANLLRPYRSWGLQDGK